jgi:hypothetical protein
MTEYNMGGTVIDEEEAFTNISIQIEKFGTFTDKVIAKRNKNPCNESFPRVGLSISENGMSFSEGTRCDTLNKIDPYFYKTTGTTNNGNSGRWEFEYKNKRMFILTNKNQPKKSTIRIIFEKSK